MKNVALLLALAASMLLQSLYAQQPSFTLEVGQLAQKLETLKADAKARLKKSLDEVDQQLEQKTITSTEAEARKKALAEAQAAELQAQMNQIQSQLSSLVQRKADGEFKSVDEDTITYKTKNIEIKVSSKGKSEEPKGESRTTTQFVLAGGVNNAFVKGHIAHSDFGYWRSHFYEIGLTMNTRLFKDNNIWHIKYGASLQYNNLRATDNRYFEQNGNQTYLQTDNQRALSDSRLRNVYLVFPVHLEWDFTPMKKVGDQKFFNSHEGFRMGIGGYIGANLGTKQFLEYDQPGYGVEETRVGDYNTTNFIYGLSTYVGHGAMSLYLKYDLNPLFTSNSFDYHQASLGLRLDIN